MVGWLGVVDVLPNGGSCVGWFYSWMGRGWLRIGSQALGAVGVCGCVVVVVVVVVLWLLACPVVPTLLLTSSCVQLRKLLLLGFAVFALILSSELQVVGEVDIAGLGGDDRWSVWDSLLCTVRLTRRRVSTSLVDKEESIHLTG